MIGVNRGGVVCQDSFTFGFQVARVEGQSMAPTLEDQDRLIVNKLHYRLDAPVVGDIVMLYYPLDPDKMFVKRVIAEEGDETVRPYADHIIEIPAVSTLFQPLLSTVPLQVFAASVARARGYDVDKPRNLAKSVTVE